MKCPECGYTSFDYLEKCKKCGAPLSPVPIFKYLYEDELSTEVVIDRNPQTVPGGILSGADAVGTAFELSPAGGSPDEGLPAGGIEDFLSFEGDFEEEFSGEEEEKEKEAPPPLPNGMMPATLWERCVAFSIEFLFTLCVAAVALFSGATLIGETFFPGLSEFVSIWGWTCLCGYVLATTYFVFLPSWCGTTLGNSAAGIRVVMSDGSLVGFQTNLLRWAGWVLSAAAVFLGFALAAFDPQRKTLSDHLCGTFVVKA